MIRWTGLVASQRMRLALSIAAVLSGALLTIAGTLLNREAAADQFTIAKRSALDSHLSVEGQTATLLPDGRRLLVGGYENGIASDATYLQPQKADQAGPTSLSMSVKLVYPRSGHSATVLPDGSIAIIGGWGRDGSLVKAIEILDIQNGETRLAGDFTIVPRADHTSILLTDGSVLIAGGVTQDGTALASAQLWDPIAGDGAVIATPLGSPRSQHRASLLTDGQVMLWGGEDSNGQSLEAVEIFNPASRSFNSMMLSSEQLEARLSQADALRVEAVLPSASDKDVPVDARVAIRFNKPLHLGEIGTNAMTLVGPGGAVTGKAVAAEKGQLLFFTPDNDLLPGATYTVFVKQAKGVTGEILPWATSSFTTQAIKDRADRAAAATTSGQAATTAVKTISDKGASPSSAAADTAPKPASKQQKKPQEAEKDKKQPDEEEETEDWTPGPEHRRDGKWRVLGLKGEPRTNRPLETPALLQAPAGITALSGRVARLNGRPIAGVRILVGGEFVATDAQGRFLITKVAAGKQQLVVDGSTARNGGRHYLTHIIQVEVSEGQTNSIAEPIYLARVNPGSVVPIASPADKEIVLTHPAIPGLEVHIPKGTVLRTPDGRIVTELSITPIPLNRVPFAVPEGFPVYFALQPAGAFVDSTSGVKGIRVIYPNYLDAASGTRVLFWNYDPNGEGWQVYGSGTVSKDGKQVLPDEGVSQQNLMAFGYGLENVGNAPPEGPPPGGCGSSTGCDPTPNPSGCAGDPVDCSTGLFIHRATDLFITDTLPIEFSRTYRPNDSISRDLGIGTNHTYGMFLSNPTGNPSVLPSAIDVVLPDGGRLRFQQVSGSTVSNIVYKHTSSPTRFMGATLRVNTVTDAWEMALRDKSVFLFQDHAPNRLIGMKDRHGNAITITRAGGNITQVRSPNGRYLNFTYDTSNRITQIVDNIGRVLTYQYDAQGRLWKATDPNSKTEEYTYDASHRMLTVKDRRGNTMVTNEYDANGRVFRQTLADNAVWQYAYTLDANGKVTQTDITNPRGLVTRMSFNSTSQLVQEVLALGQPEQQTFVYGREPSTNLLTSVTDPLGRVTKFTYDFMGNVTGVTQLYGTADAVTELYSYETTFGQLRSCTDPLNHAASLSYDAAGNLIQVRDPLGNGVTATYDAAGHLRSTTTSLGHTTQLAYDLGDLASIQDPLGRITTFLTDQAGRTVGVIDALGKRTNFALDVLNRVTQVTNALGGVTVATYDEHGNTLTVKDPRNAGTHTFTYDARDRVKTYKDPLLNVETYNYDGNGNLTSTIDRKNQTTSFTYDALDRLKTITYADSSVITITWDAGDRATTIADSANGTISRVFDGLDRLTREITPQGQVDYEYDAAGRRKKLTLLGATPVTYDYDNADRLTQITQGTSVVGITHDAANRRQAVTLPNGIVMTYSFDSANQLTEIDYDRSGTHLGELVYTYDAAGRRTRQSGSLARLLFSTSVSNASYNAANRLTQWGAETLAYDNNGNLTAWGSATYSWNARDELTSNNGTTTSYDAFGRRSGVAGMSYVHDADNPLKVSSDLMLAGLGLDEFYARIGASGAASIVSDGLGSTLQLTDHTGAATAAFAYGPYGAATKTGTDDTKFRFTGRESDGSGKLHYYRARYYAPELGRFVSEDPIGFDGGLNLYVYANGDPVSNTDPTGEFAPAGAAYGRCVAQCLAADGLGSQLPGGECFDLGGSAADCALGCLNPLNWFRVDGALDFARKVSKNKRNRDLLEKMRERQDDVRHNQGQGNWNKHTDPRPGRASEKKRAHDTWTQNRNKRAR